MKDGYNLQRFVDAQASVYENVAAELRQAQGALLGPVSRQKLLALSQKLHRVAEALDHGT